jgi:hypothetical protein
MLAAIGIYVLTLDDSMLSVRWSASEIQPPPAPPGR